MINPLTKPVLVCALVKEARRNVVLRGIICAETMRKLCGVGDAAICFQYDWHNA